MSAAAARRASSCPACMIRFEVVGPGLPPMPRPAEPVDARPSLRARVDVAQHRARARRASTTGFLRVGRPSPSNGREPGRARDQRIVDDRHERRRDLLRPPCRPGSSTCARTPSRSRPRTSCRRSSARPRDRTRSRTPGSRPCASRASRPCGARPRCRPPRRRRARRGTATRSTSSRCASSGSPDRSCRRTAARRRATRSCRDSRRRSRRSSRTRSRRARATTSRLRSW